MAGTRKLRVLRDCKYGRNEATMKCYKKGEKRSSTEKVHGNKGEKVEKKKAAKATNVAKTMKRDCKYGRNLATGKCYTKSEKTKIDKQNKQNSPSAQEATTTPPKISLKMEQQKSVTENGKQFITAIAASDKQLFIANGNKVKFWDITSDSVKFDHAEQGQKKGTIKFLAIMDKTAISATNTVITWDLKTKIMGDFFKTEKDFFGKEIHAVTISDEYLAVCGEKKDGESEIQIFKNSTSSEKLGKCADSDDGVSYKKITSMAIYGDLLFSTNEKHQIIVWDLSKKNADREFKSIRKITDDEYSFLIVKTNKLFAMTKSGGIKVWKITGGEIHAEGKIGAGHHFDDFAVSEDYVFTASKKSNTTYEISAFDISKNALATTIETTLGGGKFVDLVASKDHLFLASAKEVLVWKF
jgi:WD40 repeat protein